MPSGPTLRRRLLPPPERRRRADVVVAAGLVVVVAVVWTVLWATVPAPRHGLDARRRCRCGPAGCRAGSRQASPRRGGRPAARPRCRSSPVPWSSRATATRSPVATPLTGEVRWSYTRDIPLCTVGVGFPDNEGGRALALYRNGTWCSELTSLHPDTGTRDRQRNPDVHRGYPPPRRRVAGHGDGPDLPRGVPVGPGAHRRVRRRAHARGRSAASPVRTASRRASPRRPGGWPCCSAARTSRRTG